MSAPSPATTGRNERGSRPRRRVRVGLMSGRVGCTERAGTRPAGEQRCADAVRPRCGPPGSVEGGGLRVAGERRRHLALHLAQVVLQKVVGRHVRLMADSVVHLVAVRRLAQVLHVRRHEVQVLLKGSPCGSRWRL
eukprot:671362-Prymnesium_polylepis.2